MMFRPLLAVFRYVYDFIQAHYNTPTRLWSSAAWECKVAETLIPFAVANLRRPFDSVVQAFDASESGAG
eukprot:15378734-Heterocapsa_arctica.AAC.1